MGEVYAYLPEVSENDVLKELNGTVVDSSYGISIARGAFSFASGNWTVVAERVRLNTFNATGGANTDGEIELFVNGKSVIHATEIIIRTKSSSVFRGGHMQTFFGGSTDDWATPLNQAAWFADISAASIAKDASPADGKPAYPLASPSSSKAY